MIFSASDVDHNGDLTHFNTFILLTKNGWEIKALFKNNARKLNPARKYSNIHKQMQQCFTSGSCFTIFQLCPIMFGTMYCIFAAILSAHWDVPMLIEKTITCHCLQHMFCETERVKSIECSVWEPLEFRDCAKFENIWLHLYLGSLKGHT